jgi:membrane protease YdiL (CAAX protease family)
MTLGLILGFLRERSGSLFPSMLLHATNNGFLLWLARARPDWTRLDAVPVWTTATGAAIAGVGLILVNRTTPRAPS